MSPEQKELYWQHRKDLGESIRSDPARFKVCTQCLSIARATSPYCLWCHCYRFTSDPLMIDCVTVAAERSYIPFTAAVAPRIAFANAPAPLLAAPTIVDKETELKKHDPQSLQLPAPSKALSRSCSAARK